MAKVKHFYSQLLSIRLRLKQDWKEEWGTHKTIYWVREVNKTTSSAISDLLSKKNINEFSFKFIRHHFVWSTVLNPTDALKVCKTYFCRAVLKLPSDSCTTVWIQTLIFSKQPVVIKWWTLWIFNQCTACSCFYWSYLLTSCAAASPHLVFPCPPCSVEQWISACACTMQGSVLILMTSLLCPGCSI